MFHQPRFLWKRRHDRNTVTCWLSSRETRRRINEKTFKSNPLLAITVFNMDCCIRLRCLLAFKIVLNKPNFSRSSLRFPSAILDGAIPLDGWFVLSFEFGATALGSTFETAAVLSSCHCRAKFIWVRHGSSTTFGTGLRVTLNEDASYFESLDWDKHHVSDAFFEIVSQFFYHTFFQYL